MNKRRFDQLYREMAAKSSIFNYEPLSGRFRTTSDGVTYLAKPHSNEYNTIAEVHWDKNKRAWRADISGLKKNESAIFPRGQLFQIDGSKKPSYIDDQSFNIMGYVPNEPAMQMVLSAYNIARDGRSLEELIETSPSELKRHNEAQPKLSPAYYFEKLRGYAGNIGLF